MDKVLNLVVFKSKQILNLVDNGTYVFLLLLSVLNIIYKLIHIWPVYKSKTTHGI